MGKRPKGTPGKKAPAPSIRGLRPRAEPDATVQIVGELCIAPERLGADEELLAIVGSWHDTLSDEDVLRILRDYNASRPTLRPLR